MLFKDACPYASQGYTLKHLGHGNLLADEKWVCQRSYGQYLQLMARQPEQQIAIDAVMKKAAPVLTQTNLFNPVADLCHRPAADIMAHLCLHALVQALLRCWALHANQQCRTAMIPEDDACSACQQCTQT